MYFNESLYRRRNTYSWSEKIPSKENINKILNLLHDCSPSKQNLVRYKIDIILNNDENRRNQIYEGVRTEIFDDDPIARYNPQVLAPWLFVLSSRLENDSKKPSNPDIWLDVGIACATIVYIASSLGLDTGICRCMPYAEEKIVPIFNYRPLLFIGIGYNSQKETYYCPVYKKEMPNPIRTTKPSLNEYVKYV